MFRHVWKSYESLQFISYWIWSSLGMFENHSKEFSEFRGFREFEEFKQLGALNILRIDLSLYLRAFYRAILDSILLSLVFSRWRIWIKEQVFCYRQLLKTRIFKSFYFLNWCPILDSLAFLLHCSIFNNFILLKFMIFSQKLSNFVSLPWNLHNRYCHSSHHAIFMYCASNRIESLGAIKLFLHIFEQ